MVVGVVCKPDGNGGVWRLYLHDDGRAELLYRAAPQTPSRTLVGRIDLYEIRRYLQEVGIGEDGWRPE